eukprot:6473563-Amphidinium_carterae.1
MNKGAGRQGSVCCEVLFLARGCLCGSFQIKICVCLRAEGLHTHASYVIRAKPSCAVPLGSQASAPHWKHKCKGQNLLCFWAVGKDGADEEGQGHTMPLLLSLP